MAATVAAAAAPLPDWSAAQAEMLGYFTDLVRIDTSNPPGNETLAAEYLKRVLDSAGVEAKLFALDPARANLVARLRGSGRKRPILLMAHTDVVGVQRDQWKFEPFGAVRTGGFIYGRGTVDDKDTVAAALTVMLLLKRLNVALDRDVIFLAEAGEEGTTDVGIDYMVARHWREIDAEFAFAEGGGGSGRDGLVRMLTVSTTEKVPRGVTLRARGTAGHGSVPREDNPVVQIAEAVARVSAWQSPVRLNETTRAYFSRLASISPGEYARRYRDVLDRGRVHAVAKYFARNEPAHHSMLRTTIVPTLIDAGFRENVIPSDAHAILDIRALPDEDMPALFARIRRLVRDDRIEITQRRERPAAAPSPLDSEAFLAIERVQRRLYPSAVTVPTMLTGATDMAQLRAKGMQCYGIGPVSEDRYAGAFGAHGDNERIEEAALTRFLEFLWTLVLELAEAR